MKTEENRIAAGWPAILFYTDLTGGRAALEPERTRKERKDEEWKRTIIQTF